jgi:hypothetical protein
LSQLSIPQAAKQLGPAIAPGTNRPDEAEAMSGRLYAGRRCGVRRDRGWRDIDSTYLGGDRHLVAVLYRPSRRRWGRSQKIGEGEEPRMRVVRVGGCASFSAAIDHDGGSLNWWSCQRRKLLAACSTNSLRREALGSCSTPHPIPSSEVLPAEKIRCACLFFRAQRISPPVAPLVEGLLRPSQRPLHRTHQGMSSLNMTQRAL